MPHGPKGQKRPADVIGNAVKVMRIATGEEQRTSRPTTARTRLRSRWGSVAEGAGRGAQRKATQGDRGKGGPQEMV